MLCTADCNKAKAQGVEGLQVRLMRRCNKKYTQSPERLTSCWSGCIWMASETRRHSSQRAIEALKHHARELSLSPRGTTIGSLRDPIVIALGVLQRSLAVGHGNHRALRRSFGRRDNQGLACWGRDVVFQCCGLYGGPVGDQRRRLRYSRGFDRIARDRARRAAPIGCQILTQGTGFVADPIGLTL